MNSDFTPFVIHIRLKYEHAEKDPLQIKYRREGKVFAVTGNSYEDYIRHKPELTNIKGRIVEVGAGLGGLLPRIGGDVIDPMPYEEIEKALQEFQKTYEGPLGHILEERLERFSFYTRANVINKTLEEAMQDPKLVGAYDVAIAFKCPCDKELLSFLADRVIYF